MRGSGYMSMGTVYSPEAKPKTKGQMRLERMWDRWRERYTRARRTGSWSARWVFAQQGWMWIVTIFALVFMIALSDRLDNWMNSPDMSRR